MSYRSSGMRAWLLQRATAVVLLVFIVYAAYMFFTIQTGRAGLVSLFRDKFFAITATLALLAILLHGWVGIRDIIMDYVKPYPLRVTAYLLTLTYILYLLFWWTQLYLQLL